MIECGKQRFSSFQELLKEVRAKNQEAVGCLYDLMNHHCYPVIKAYFLRRGRPEADVEDFYQEAFLVLYANIKNGKFKLRPLSSKPYLDQLCAYLMQVAKNQLLKAIRWESRPLMVPDEEFSVQEETEYLFQLAWEYALNMQEPCRELLFRRYAQKLSVSEIGKGQEPKMNAKAVRNSLSRCLHQLLSGIKQALEPSREKIELEQLALATLEEMEEPCRSFLGLFYSNEDKKSMEEIAGILGYKNANVAKVARVECLKKLHLKIAQKLLGNTSLMVRHYDKDRRKYF